MPELPLLGVLPGTGGLTRVVDKRHVRRDRADYFATRAEGVPGKKAAQWGLVDETVPRSKWTETVAERAVGLTGRSNRPSDVKGTELAKIDKSRTDTEILPYDHARPLRLHRNHVEITVKAPDGEPGLAMLPMVIRELDDLILDLRTNEPELGTWVLRTEGDPARILSLRRAAARPPRRLAGQRDRPVPQAHPQAARRDQPQPDRADRAGQLLRRLAPRTGAGRGPLLSSLRGSTDAEPRITVGPMNLGPLPMGNDLTRLQTRFYGDDQDLETAEAAAGQAIGGDEAEQAEGSSPSRPTTSTGTTRCASPSRSGPASAPTR